MAANRMGEVYATNVGSTIHNHEVAGSCPALATVNQEVTIIRVVVSFYLYTICTQNIELSMLFDVWVKLQIAR